MNYKETLHYLLDQLPMFQRTGAAAYRSNLDNITALSNILGNPQNDLKCVHVAGTNGKGSVTHIIASILQEQGYSVGIFVSPHYKDFRERVKVNGKYISRQFVKSFVGRNIHKFKNINASFFEITTAMAFAYFKHKEVDYAIIETGMGGRLDSTNIITPMLSVITNISLDHTQFLGKTLKSIAREKAGIIKPDIPLVIGETQKETKQVFIEKAKACSSKIYFADKVVSTHYIKSSLHGVYQQKNIVTAICAIQVLKIQGVTVSASAVKAGLQNIHANTAFIGRWMIMHKKPLIIFDSAHNEGGIKELLKGLGKLKFNQLHFIYGTVNDKDISNILKLMPKNAKYYFCKADIPRALDTGTLIEQAQKFKLHGAAYTSVKSALKAAKENACTNDLIMVAGSVFVVAEVI